MTTIMPEGESIRKAVKWISCRIEEYEKEKGKTPPYNELINEAILKFDLSPKDAEFLIKFYKESLKKGDCR